jgi:hypothetical protein
MGGAAPILSSDVKRSFEARSHNGRKESLMNRRTFLRAAGGAVAATAVYQAVLSIGPKAEGGDSGPSSLKRMGWMRVTRLHQSPRPHFRR